MASLRRESDNRAGCVCSRLGNAATTGARTDEVRCFLCDSTDARRSGPASERLLRQGESERLALASLLAARLSRQNVSGSRGGRKSDVCQADVARQSISSCGPGSRSNAEILGQGGRLPCEERKVLLHVAGPAMLLQCNLQLNHISTGGLLTPSETFSCEHVI